MKSKSKVVIVVKLAILVLGLYSIGMMVFEHYFRAGYDQWQMQRESQDCDKLTIMFPAYSIKEYNRKNQDGTETPGRTITYLPKPLKDIDGVKNVREFIDAIEFTGNAMKGCDCASPPYWQLWKGGDKKLTIGARHMDTEPLVGYRGRFYRLTPQSVAKVKKLYKKYNIPDYIDHLAQQEENYIRLNKQLEQN